MNVLLVDDEIFALKDLNETVSESISDASIKSFQNPGDAVVWAENNKVDIAFLDIEMNKLNGLQLAQKIKDINKNANIIFITAYAEYALDAFSVQASDYVMKPATAEKIRTALENLRKPLPKSGDTGLRIQTFGNFEVFYNGDIVMFPRSKSKELLAYLIHKKGTGCTVKECASILYEDKTYSLSIQKQMQTILSTLMKVLREIGEEDIIIKKYNSTSIDIKHVNCDYYKFLAHDQEAVNQYMGEYMSNYGWAEFTIGYLDSRA